MATLSDLFRRLFSRSTPVSVPRPTPAPRSKTRSRLVVGGAGTALLAATIAFVGGWEGKRNEAYRDVVGIWTACYGETRNIKPGMKFTDAECDAQFAPRLVEFEQGIRACLTAPDAIPDGAYRAFVSVSYNIGIRGFCRSSMARKANAGDLVGACNSLRLWNKAGGRVVRGLDNRRRAEQKICLGSLR